jgi:hypothetical protein
MSGSRVSPHDGRPEARQPVRTLPAGHRQGAADLLVLALGGVPGRVQGHQFGVAVSGGAVRRSVWASGRGRFVARRLDPGRPAAALQVMATDPGMRVRAAVVAARLRREDGVVTAIHAFNEAVSRRSAFDEGR